MQLTAKTQSFIQLLNDLLISGYSSGGQILFTPKGATFKNAYFRSSLCFGIIRPAYFESYEVSENERSQFRSTMLSKLKSIKDDMVSVYTAQENIIFQGTAIDSYDEPLSALDDEIPIEFSKNDNGFYVPLDHNTGEFPELSTELLVKLSNFAALPTSDEYFISFSDSKLTISVRELGNFNRKIDAEEVYKNDDIAILLDRDNFKYVLGGHTDDCVLTMGPGIVVTNYRELNYTLTLVAATRRQ